MALLRFLCVLPFAALAWNIFKASDLPANLNGSKQTKLFNKKNENILDLYPGIGYICLVLMKRNFRLNMNEGLQQCGPFVFHKLLALY